MNLKNNKFIVKATTAFTTNFNKVKFAANKNAPELLLIGALVTGIGAIVTACIATTKVDEVVDEAQVKIDQIHEGGLEGAEKVKALIPVYGTTAFKFAKKYAVPAALFGVSVACAVKSNSIHRAWENDLNEALIGMTAAYNACRNELEGKSSPEESKSESKTVDEDGNPVDTMEFTNKIINGVQCSPFAFTLDTSNPYWNKDPYAVVSFLRDTDEHLSYLLRQRKVLTLKEIKDYTGYYLQKDDNGEFLKPSKWDLTFGLIYKSEDPNCLSDDDVRLRIYERNNLGDFTARKTNQIIIDPNVVYIYGGKDFTK